MLNVTKSNPLGDYPSGKNIEDLLESVFQYASKAIHAEAGTAQNDAEAEEDGEAGGGEGGNVADEDANFMGRKKMYGWAVYHLIGPFANQTNRSILLFAADVKGNRVQQRREAKEDASALRASTLNRGQDASEMKLRASMAQANEAAEIRREQSKLCGLTALLDSTGQQMDRALRILQSDPPLPQTMRDDALKKYTRLDQQMEETEAEIMKYTAAKRVTPSAVTDYLDFKKPRPSSPRTLGGETEPPRTVENSAVGKCTAGVSDGSTSGTCDAEPSCAACEANRCDDVHAPGGTTTGV